MSTNPATTPVDEDVAGYAWTAYNDGFKESGSMFTVAIDDQEWLDTAALINEFSYTGGDGTPAAIKLFKTKLEYEFNGTKLSCYVIERSNGFKTCLIGNPYLMRQSFGSAGSPVTLDFPDNLQPIAIDVGSTRNGLYVTFFIKNDTETSRTTLDLNLILLNLIDEVHVVNLDNLYFSVNGEQLQLIELQAGLYVFATEEAANKLGG